MNAAKWFRSLVFGIAASAAVCMPCAVLAQSAVTPMPLASPANPADARGRNLVILDSVVFVLGVGILGGVLVYWGLRIYKEN